MPPPISPSSPRRSAQARVAPASRPGKVVLRAGRDPLDVAIRRPLGDEHGTGRRSPTKDQVVLASNEACRYNPALNFAFNLMADLVCQGLRWDHPSPAKQARAREWWERVRGPEVARQYVSTLLRHGFNCVQVVYGSLAPEDAADLARPGRGRGRRGIVGRAAAPGVEVPYAPQPHPGSRRIPLAYKVLNPLQVQADGRPEALLELERPYYLRVSGAYADTVRRARPDAPIVSTIGNDLLLNQPAGGEWLRIDPEHFRLNHFRKDDFEPFGDPVTLPVLKAVGMYDKLVAADEAALKGAMSRVRLWRFGLPEHRIPASQEGMDALEAQLRRCGDGATADLIWGADLDFKESSADYYKVLGEEKYRPHLAAIFYGLGIPAGLSGLGSAGLSSDALGLKGLVERLKDLQGSLRRFWQAEARLVQLAFGDRDAAVLRCEAIDLADVTSMLNSVLAAWDRDLLSDATVQERYGAIPAVEARRIRDQRAAVAAGTAPGKLGQFCGQRPNPEAAAQAMVPIGLFAPSEAGVRRLPKARGDETTIEAAPAPAPAASGPAADDAPPGRSGAGRPPGKKDAGTRSRRAKPRVTKAAAAGDDPTTPLPQPGETDAEDHD